jgi:P-type conjugative transfer protein TrbJ
MKQSKKRIIVVAAIAALLLPTAAHADIVFDPANFVEAVLQVVSDVQMVEQFAQQVEGEASMLQHLNFSQLNGLVENMNTWQQVFGQSIYSSTDPGTTVNNQYPTDPGSYANTSDSSYQSMQSGWDQEDRNVLIENRTVQNETYLNLSPTADRIQQLVEHSNSASGATAAMQAGNQETAELIAQLQTLQAQEITDARGEVERDARRQAEDTYGQQQRQSVRGTWDNPQQPTTTVVDAFPAANQ